MKRAVTFRQRPTDRRVVKERQAAHGNRVQKGHPHQSLADRAEVGRPGLDDRPERGHSHIEGRRVVQCQPLHFLECAAVPEKHVQIAGPRAQGRVGRRRQFLLEPIPGGRLDRLAPAGQGVAQPRDHLRLERFSGRRPAASSKRVYWAGAGLDLLAEPPRDQPLDAR